MKDGGRKQEEDRECVWYMYLIDVFLVCALHKVLSERSSVAETLECRVHETRITCGENTN